MLLEYILLCYPWYYLPLCVSFSFSLCVWPSHFPSPPLFLTHSSHPASLLSSTPSLTLRFRLAKARNPVQPAAGMSCLSYCVCVCVCVKLVRLVLLFDFDVVHCLRAKLLPVPAFPKRQRETGEGRREQWREIAREMAVMERGNQERGIRGRK